MTLKARKPPMETTKVFIVFQHITRTQEGKKFNGIVIILITLFFFSLHQNPGRVFYSQKMFLMVTRVFVNKKAE